MSIFKKLLQFIPAGLGLLGQAVGIKPTNVPIKHIGPAHVYNDFDMCVHCPRYDRKRVSYTVPPCPRNVREEEA